MDFTSSTTASFDASATLAGPPFATKLLGLILSFPENTNACFFPLAPLLPLLDF
ncbi:MAG: hypothetical protein J7J91_11955 [Deltaproteobacteria bacterium]|nr:hypothetical protein [Deltaproteobacteria bacterium]